MKRPKLHFITYILIPLILLLFFISSYSDILLLREYSLFTGIIAFWMILFILFIKPVVILFPRLKSFKFLLLYRREMGIVTFYISLFHGISQMIIFQVFSNLEFYLNFQNFIIYGFLGLMILTILYLTSNDWSQKKLKKNWKRIQQLLYLALIFIVIHVALVKDTFVVYLILLLFFALKGAEIYKIKSKMKKVTL